MKRQLILVLSLLIFSAVANGLFQHSFDFEQNVPQSPLAEPITVDDADTLQMAYSGAIGQTNSAYHFQSTAAGYRALNNAHNLSIEVNGETVIIAIAEDIWQLTSNAPASDFSLNNNRLTIHRDGYDEWYINGPMGLQQGFTLFEPADIRFDTGGTLPTSASTSSLSIGDKLTFSGLMAFDVQGKDIPVEFAFSDNRLAYVYDDAGATYPLIIDPFVQRAKLTASDGAAEDYFGSAVALDGDTALIGARNDDDNGDVSGSAYIFVRSGGIWNQQAKLLPSDGTASDFFGEAVALSGDTALIGSRGDDDNGLTSGSAYIFVRSGGIWSQQAKLLPTDGEANDLFGDGVALDGDTALIGAPGGDGADTYTGSAYIFVRNSGIWTQQAKLFASDGAYLDRFGSAVALEGDTALIGVYLDNPNGSESGSAYVFVRNGNIWSEHQKLIPGDGKVDDHFGAVVALSGDTALITADAGYYAGSAYIFTLNSSTWSQQAKLLPFGSIDSKWFGRSADLDGDTAVVRAVGKTFFSTGHVFVYTRSGTTWYEQNFPVPDDAVNADRFGHAIAIDGDTLLVSSINDDDNGVDSGSAYIFNFEPGAIIRETNGNTKVYEDSPSFIDSYTVVLDVPPAAGEIVTINLSSNTTTGVIVSPTSLNFDLSNWTVPQTVTVAAVDDSVIEEHDHSDTISHTLITTGGMFTSGVPVRNVIVTIRDNDYYPVVASATCVGENLDVTITAGDGKYSIYGQGVNLPVWSVTDGTHTIIGPEKWDNVTVKESSGDYESLNLGQFKCRPAERPMPLTPLHQSHTTDPFPVFSWTSISDATNYRVFVFDEKDLGLRTVDIRENSGGPTSMTLSTPLPDGRLFWRARARVNRIWSLWSIRFTLFKDPVVVVPINSDAAPVVPPNNIATPIPTVEHATPLPLESPPDSGPPPTSEAPPPADLPKPPNSR